MNIENITFPVMKIPGRNLLEPIHKLAEAMIMEGGSLKEIWVSRKIYDQLTAEILDRDRYMTGSNQGKWKNGLIVIETASGRVKIRLGENET